MNDSGLDMLRKNPPMRQRRQRTNFNESQIRYLDEMFTKNPYPDINERDELATSLKTTEDRIQVWFQNKRARYRKKMNTSKKNASSSSSSTDDKENTPKRAHQDSAYQSQLLNNSSSITPQHSTFIQQPLITFNHSTPYNHSFYIPLFYHQTTPFTFNTSPILNSDNRSQKLVFKPYE
jgi:hypothetical protein